ncbi:hypothetical protein [Neolewinella antarctica]|uniref:DUF4340 domain-containing protein n=1 Tax=Neolewinella antarctica TaxID=442734 RepID=A0ABX0X878_9BACT|nr:hypothetical protein [Neolewinella antarctica]NJC25206.1 hypothetical protein [Neolewinella antarctica]
MNRTSILLLAVLVLGAGAWLILRKDATENSLADKGESRQFGYADVDRIDRIFIADRKGNRVDLTRGGVSGWLADGVPANENIMLGILQVIEGLDVQSLPSYKAIPVILEDLATSGTLIQLFDADNNKLRGYYLGGTTADETGTYAIKEGVEDPYVVHLPGFTGNVRQRVVHVGDEWRDKIYWRVDPEKVESFSIEYPKLRNKSFVLTKNGDRFQLKPFYASNQQTRNVPRGGVEGILTRYEKYYVNAYENLDEKSITAARDALPHAVIRVKEEGKPEQTMVIYPRYGANEFTNNPKTGAIVNRGGLKAYSAFINDGADWALLNVETIQPLMIGYDYF